MSSGGSGKIVQIIGAVIDVEFFRGAIRFPKSTGDAPVLDDVDLTLEVQQQLGDGDAVRCDRDGCVRGGLRRGLAGKEHRQG